jgi:steroid 5-alpha reductase family enzyme
VDSVDLSAFGASLLWTALAVVVVFGITFAIAVRVGKHAVVDVTWGLGFVVAAIVSLLVTGGSARGVLVTVMVALWGLRLAGHIYLRSRGKGEDPRYEALMAKAPGNPNLYALQRVYTTQAVILWFVAFAPQAAITGDGGPGLLAYVGVVVWAVGLFFEAVGDWQLQKFRDDPSTTGKVLDTGLWRYTRHPNYFGDATAWWGIWLVALDAGGWFTILSPVVMTWLLAKGTGAALLEKDIGDRRPEYVDYVRRTSGFVPLPPKKHA